MNKTLISLAMLALSLTASAQQTAATPTVAPQAMQLRIGYFSYDAVLRSLPDYAVAQESLATLKKQYDAEVKAAQDEFNEKFELFLEQQSRLAGSILRKRQADLQQLLERNEQFAKESQRLLAQAEKEALAPVHAKLKTAIAKAGEQGQYTLIVNTDSDACPYIAPALATDATDTILSLCK